MTLSDVQAGLKSTYNKTIITTDQQEINEVIKKLNEPILLKTIPKMGSVEPNPNDRFELRITVVSNSKGVLEYYLTSEGDINIKKDNVKHFSNVILINGNTVKWFDDLKTLFCSKEQNVKWSSFEN